MGKVMNYIAINLSNPSKHKLDLIPEIDFSLQKSGRELKFSFMIRFFICRLFMNEYSDQLYKIFCSFCVSTQRYCTPELF